MSSDEKARKGWVTIVTAPVEFPSRDGVYFPKPDAAVALQEYGRDVVHFLPANGASVTFGKSRRSDRHVLDQTMSSAHFEIKHEILDRAAASRAVVRDVGSTNGLWSRGARVSSLSARPGETFVAGDTKFLICDSAMRANRHTFAEILGTHNLELVDNESAWAIDEEAVGGSTTHIIVIGTKASGSFDLARAIHATSRRRDAELRSISADTLPATTGELSMTSRCSLLLDLSEPAKRVRECIDAIWSRRHSARLIAVADDVSHALRLVKAQPQASVHLVFIPEFADRSDNQGEHRIALLDYMLRERGVALQFEHLTTKNQSGLLSHWATDNQQLLQLADFFSRIARLQYVPVNQQELALTIGVPRSTFYDWTMRHYFELPFFRR
ncbi:MAG TPA: FHA domain-containing protein [Kofleriaceae bacterium]|jgi:pSer/pThr/pTyr-binding forkhead associated (FHA) protein